jgi:type I restriction enzyme, S subunit
MRSDLPSLLATGGRELTTLGKLCSDGGGDIQTGPFGSQLHAADYVEGGIPVIMPQDIVDGRISMASIATIGEEDAQRLSRYRVRAGDIVYSRRGDIRRRVLIHEAENDWLCGTGCLRVRIGDGAEPSYVAAYLGHPAVQGWIERHAVGATMPNLNTSILSAVPVALPARDEQTRVAEVLCALDDKIDSNRRLAALLEEPVATLFRARFVDFIGVGEFEDSEIGDVPLGWSVKRIDQLAAINNVSLTARSHPDQIAYLDISSVGPGNIDEVQDLAFDKAPSRARRVVRDGDTIVSTVRPERRSFAFIHKIVPEMTASTGFAVVTPTLGAPTFIYNWVTSNACINHLAAAATGSAYPAVNPRVLAAWRVPVPPDNGAEFEAFARPIEASRHALARESAALRDIRNALLPKLISGEVRVAA